jgi:hypothetical protein
LPHNQRFPGRLAQLGERLPYKQEVTGSSPVPPIPRSSLALSNALPYSQRVFGAELARTQTKQASCLTTREAKKQYFEVKFMNTDTDLGRYLIDLEAVSKRRFGRKCHLLVAAVILSRDSPVWARQVARTIDIGENQAASELSEFTEMRALQLVPSDYDRRKIYQRVSHHFWDHARATVDETIEARTPGGAADFWATLARRSVPKQSLEEDG